VVLGASENFQSVALDDEGDAHCDEILKTRNDRSEPLLNDVVAEIAEPRTLSL
jgi:hypothetical protein